MMEGWMEVYNGWRGGDVMRGHSVAVWWGFVSFGWLAGGWLRVVGQVVRIGIVRMSMVR